MLVKPCINFCSVLPIRVCWSCLGKSWPSSIMRGLSEVTINDCYFVSHLYACFQKPIGLCKWRGSVILRITRNFIQGRKDNPALVDVAERLADIKQKLLVLSGKGHLNILHTLFYIFKRRCSSGK